MSMCQQFLNILKSMDYELYSKIIIMFASLIGIGFSMVGGIGPAVGIGYATGSAVDAIASYPEHNGVTSTLILGSAIASSTGIYSLVIALILMYANPFISRLFVK